MTKEAEKRTTEVLDELLADDELFCDEVCCCDADCHIITSEEEFQALLRGLQS